ncbi:hypothetical protein CFT12S00416_07860 [Campylobacter fetus subsp. testudinum]|uniref:hypothetical protein n=1 Tax=Campylobacter fetus TaxID=196 RepID=UPI00081894DA|nr:hypothetical protein [Campylobacter fetus]OCR87733.1 hypothetical protein CFT12S00416_07860 [Campylobacter fetus subsp. testudinum]OCR98847.1 hypothetical protein A9K75_09665 [Campylobacter fetus subsp. testudinum]
MVSNKDERVKDFLEKTTNFNLDKELFILVTNIKYGKSANIFINCTDMETKTDFYFSVFFNNNYFSKSSDFDFKKYKNELFENSKYLAVKFVRSKTGYLVCVNAKIIDIEYLEQKDTTLFTEPA